LYFVPFLKYNIILSIVFFSYHFHYTFITRIIISCVY